jgi:tetratricopeptide (TPR) repeat protein/predicted Ser/Thr protein kinase
LGWERTKTTLVGGALEDTKVDEHLDGDESNVRQQPQQIGRFAVLRKLGEGGMGVVYSGYDEELDRRVAIKVVRRTDAHSTERMRREAQAMAKLSHPNVATVYEVGAWDGQLYLAIEFVKGKTLKQWWQDEEPPLERVIEVMSQAGRGLQAAHDAGLVHRDFKPDNVMIGEDGRVRVLDFGLAGSDLEQGPTPEGAAESMIERLAGHNPFDTPLTMTGTLMGTPAYMSPEQFVAESAGPQSDQFSFCVTLYELLYGERPFEGDTMSTLAASVAVGDVRPPPRTSLVPTGVREIVLQGLATNKADRHDDIRTLLAALEAETRGGSRALMTLVGLATLAALAVGAKMTIDHRQLAAKRKACETRSRLVDEAWSEDKEAEVRKGILATEVNYAATVADKVVPWLNRSASSWKVASRTACMKNSVHEIWDEARIDKVNWCLEDQRLRLGALVQNLTEADAGAVRGAIAAAASLVRAEECTDEARLSTMPPPPPLAVRTRVGTIRGGLARANALEATGRYDAALELIQPLRGEVEMLNWGPLTAQTLTQEARVLARKGAYAESEAANMSAFVAAGRAGAWDTAARAANQLISTIGNEQARHTEGLAWAELATMAIDLAGDPLELRESRRLDSLGSVHFAMGDHELALEGFRSALEINQRILGSAHPTVADNLGNLGRVHLEIANYDEARTYLNRSLLILEENFGPDHPAIAQPLRRLASLAGSTGERERSGELYRKALEIQEQALGPDHAQVSDSLNDLGVWHAKGRDFKNAGDLFSRAFDIQEAALGPHHRDLAQPLNNLGNINKLLGDYEKARSMFQRALEISERTRGPNHAKVAVSLFNLGDVVDDMGDMPQAVEYYRRALAIFEEALGADHPRVAYSANALGVSLAALNEFEEALSSLERALRLRSKKDTPPDWLATTQFDLAKTLWAAPTGKGRDRKRSRELATLAQSGFSALGEVHESSRAEVENWLSEHGD